MNQDKVHVVKNSVAPTVLLLVISATIGAVVGSFLIFLSTLMGSMFGNFFVWFLMFFPVILAAFTTWIGTIIFIAPIWTLVFGGIFTSFACGAKGSVATQKNLTLFSETHPISEATKAMADRLSLPMPHIGWYPSEDINAFAMGTRPENALVGLSQGAIEKLSKDELDAVIGHELGHIASDDMARMTYARGIQSGLTFFLLFQGLKRIARWLFTPISELEILRFSRTREFAADKIGAKLTSTEAMIAVLEKLKSTKNKAVTDGTANIMFHSANFNQNWLSTHPPLEERIRVLKKIR